MELHYQSTSHESAELTAFNENLELNLGWPLSKAASELAIVEAKTGNRTAAEISRKATDL